MARRITVSDGNLIVEATVDSTAYKVGGVAFGDSVTYNVGSGSGQLGVNNADGGKTYTFVDAGAGEGPVLTVDRDSSSPAASDIIGSLRFDGRTSTGATVRYGWIYTTIIDPTNGAEYGRITFRTRDNGASNDVLRLGTGAQIGSPTGGDQGLGTLNIASDYYVNGALYSNTVRTWQAGQRGEVTTLTDAANISINMNDSNNFTVTLAGNRILDNPTNMTAGQSGVITVVQDATGSRTLSYGTFYNFVGGTAPTLSITANAIDTLSYYVLDTTNILITDSLNWS